ncbi:hypothetical protein GGS20DRAFT_580357 [Poronia punctata]|nr:hypothetical protein GGS20DRAFT_580357 [Poronia punctata]
MAYTRDVAGKHRKHKRQTSYSDAGDWEPPRDASRHSLPYQAQQHSEVQRPVGRKSKHSTSQRTKQPVDVPVSRAMPPSRMLTRSGPVKSRNRRVYDEDEEDERDRKERLRGRMQSRSRSRVKIRARSPSSESSAGSFIATPTRSSYVHHRSAHPSAPPSAPSPGSDSESSSGETDSSDSTEDYGNRPPTLKERMNGKSTAPGTPDSASVRNPASRSQSRHRRRNEVVLEVETISDSSEDDAPPLPRVVVKGSAMAQRHKHQSRASSAAPPRQQSRHRGRHRETHTSYSPKRPCIDIDIDISTTLFRSQNRYFYYSDVPYTEKPPFSRSRATSSSPVTFHSLSSSAARRSATFPGNNFFEAPDYPIHHSKSYKL